MVTLDEPSAHVMRNAKSLGIDLPTLAEKGLIRVWYDPPQELNLDEHCAHLEALLSGFRPERVVIDSLGSYLTAAGSDDRFRNFFHALVSLMREQRITAVYNFENPEMMTVRSRMPGSVAGEMCLAPS